MGKILYDRIINVVLHQSWIEKGKVYEGFRDDLKTVTWTENEGHFTISCDNMQLKPNIKVKFSALPDSICYGCTVTVTNLMYSLDIQKYVAMDITLGYRYTSDPTSSFSTSGTSLSGEGKSTITLKSPIFTSYQTSPNPDGETIFEGVVVGNMFDITEDCPVQLTIHTTEETTYDNNGNEIKQRVCRVPLDEFLRMIAQSRGNTIKYNPVSGKSISTNNAQTLDTYQADPKRLERSYTVMMQVPGEGDGAVELVGEAGEKMRNYMLDISSLSSKLNPTFLTLVKNAGDLIRDQLNAAFGIRTTLTLWNDKLMLMCPDFAGTNFKENNPYQPIKYVYSCSYEATLLRVSAPYIPTIYPGCLIRVTPSYYNGANLPNVVDALSYAILEQGKITADDILHPEGFYSVLTMDVEFGTYDGNTMNLLCVPIKLSSDSVETKISAEENMSGYLEKMQEAWDDEHIADLDYSYLIFGDSDPISGNVTAMYSVTANINAYSAAALTQVHTYDTLSKVAKRLWGAESMWNAGTYADMYGKSGFQYVKSVRDDGEIIPAIYKTGDRVKIPFSEFWPVIIITTKAYLDDTSQNNLTKDNCGIRYEENNPDLLHSVPIAVENGSWAGTGLTYVYAPFAGDSDIQAGTETAHKEIYLYAGNWARERLIAKVDTYTNTDVANLYNIYIFLGGSIDDIQ